MSTEDQNKALSKAKIGVMTKPNSVFWSTCMMGLNHHFDESIPTAGTNGFFVKYNPDFFMKETPPKRTGLVFHETGHVVLDHAGRLGDKDPEIYNWAADNVINILALDFGFELPDCGVWDFKYRGWSTEEIYADAPQNFKPPPQMPRDIMPGDGPADPAAVEEHKAQLDDLLVRAVMASKAANEKPGAIPGQVEEYVDKLLNPKISWYRILRRFMTRFIKKRHTFTKPNKRYMPIIMPGMTGEALANIAEAFDLSGSVTSEQLQHYVTESDGIFAQLKPEKMTLLQFDTKLTKEPEVITDRKQLTKVTFKGRGGTRIDPVMQWAKDNRPTVLVVFTDGYFANPSIDPKVPVIWVINDNPKFEAPFGKVIHFELEE